MLHKLASAADTGRERARSSSEYLVARKERAHEARSKHTPLAGVCCVVCFTVLGSASLEAGEADGARRPRLRAELNAVWRVHVGVVARCWLARFVGRLSGRWPFDPSAVSLASRVSFVAALWKVSPSVPRSLVLLSLAAAHKTKVPRWILLDLNFLSLTRDPVIFF